MKSPSLRSTTAIVALALAALALALVPTALGAKGGKPGTGTSATLTGVVSDGSYTVTGTGFKPGEIVALTLYEAGGCCSALNRQADDSGGFTYVGQLVGSGSYTVKASVLVRSRWRVVAQWSFAA